MALHSHGATASSASSGARLAQPFGSSRCMPSASSAGSAFSFLAAPLFSTTLTLARSRGLPAPSLPESWL